MVWIEGAYRAGSADSRHEYAEGGPETSLADTNVDPAGSGALKTTSCASDGPLLANVTE